MSTYAQGTKVSPEKSQSEIGNILRRYGATAASFGWEPGRVLVAFVAHDRQVRFEVVMPTDPDAFVRNSRGTVRTPQARQSAMVAEQARLWRSLCLALKAKLEVVASGIATFEQEFLANIVLPGGETVGQHVQPALAEVYAGQPPRGLLALQA